MSEKLPVISGKQLIALLVKLGFTVVRINGSHHRLRHSDGRTTTVPLHRNDPIPKGLLRKILREDIETTVEEFHKLID